MRRCRWTTVEESQPPKECQIAINLVIADQLNIQIDGGLPKKASSFFVRRNR
jgi:hypothetical protein